MGSLLKMRAKKALKFLSRLTNSQFISNDIQFIPNYGMSISDGATYYNDDTGFAESVELGLQEIVTYDSDRLYFLQSCVPDNYIVRSTINVFHEYMHCLQNSEMFRKNNLSNDEQCQFIQDIACDRNPDFYENNGNYLITASEIQAEQYGILQTYEYLQEQFPNLSKKQCENVVLDVVNEKMLTPGIGYFVKQNHPFTSLADVNGTFDDAYQYALHTKRYYDIRDLEAGDYAKEYLRDHPDVEYNYDFDALEQSKFIAAINIQR